MPGDMISRQANRPPQPSRGSVDEQITDLQRRHAHQDELIRQLDEALREQSRRLDGLAGKVEMLIQHVKDLGPADDGGGGEEPPPPHY